MGPTFGCQNTHALGKSTIHLHPTHSAISSSKPGLSRRSWILPNIACFSFVLVVRRDIKFSYGPRAAKLSRPPETSDQRCNGAAHDHRYGAQPSAAEGTWISPSPPFLEKLWTPRKRSGEALGPRMRPNCSLSLSLMSSLHRSCPLAPELDQMGRAVYMFLTSSVAKVDGPSPRLKPDTHTRCPIADWLQGRLKQISRRPRARPQTEAPNPASAIVASSLSPSTVSTYLTVQVQRAMARS
ncbi:hypothetical protein C8Q79DRAFT_458458 [Trametes meyenii]|nr:hypothetical protein C8Q79DRAFT_458458 [Trametes meyenii]